MKAAARWIDQYRAFWEHQFASLERYSEKTGAGRKTKRFARKKKDRP